MLCLLALGAVALIRGPDDGAPSPPDAVETTTGHMQTYVATDSSGNDHDGIIQGNVTIGLPGHDGSSYSFVRRGSWIQVPSSPELNPGADDFLASVWVSLEELPGPGETYDVFRKGVAFTIPGEFKLEVMTEGRIRCSAKDASGRLASVTSVETVRAGGGWQQIGCARTGPWWSALVGDVARSHFVELGSVENTVALSIGSKYGLEDRPRGQVDDVKLIIDREPDTAPGTVNQDLTPEIRALSQLPPAGWWRLDEAATGAAGR